MANDAKKQDAKATEPGGGQPAEKPKAVGTEYQVLIASVEGGPYSVHSVQRASDEQRARKQAVQGDEQLLGRVLAGENVPVLVCVPVRYWQPRHPKSKQREPVLEV